MLYNICLVLIILLILLQVKKSNSHLSGKKILESYKNLHQWLRNGCSPEKDEILREYTEEMRNLGLILTDQGRTVFA